MKVADVVHILKERALPRRSDYDGLSRSYKQDIVAGITVGIVALPLALAFGVSSGVGAGPGLITAIIAGFVAAIFGGSNFQVSGPTGAMTVVLLPIVVVGALAGGLVGRAVGPIAGFAGNALGVTGRRRPSRRR